MMSQCLKILLFWGLIGVDVSMGCAMGEVGVPPQQGGGEAGAKMPSEAIISLLDKVEKSGAKLKSFQGKMVFRLEKTLVETLTKRNGHLYYQTDGQRVQARIHFDDYVQMDIDDERPPVPIKFNEDYAFDGLWVVRRNERTKNIQKWEVSKQAHNRETFRIGKGPFPLPFAIQRADMLAHFEVEILKPDKKLPDTVHVSMTPKKKSPYAKEYLRLELWVSNKLNLPIQIRYEKDNFEITTVTWSKPVLDKKIDKKVFALPAPGPDWTEEITPLKEKAEEKKAD